MRAIDEIGGGEVVINSNQEAREILANLEAAYRDLDPLMLDDDSIQLVNERIEALEVAISALREQIWILCDERMPEEHEWIGTKKFGTTKSDEVYVTFENPKGERFCRHLCFQNGGLSDYDKQLIDTWFKGSKPIAWKPLPEPWNGGKEGK